MFINDQFNIVLECRAEIDGATEDCPPDLTAFHVMSRDTHISDEHLQKVQQELTLRTHDCYNVTLERVEVSAGRKLAAKQDEFVCFDIHSYIHVVVVVLDACVVADHCRLSDFVTNADFEPRHMLGVWNLLAKLGTADYLSYSLNIEYISPNVHTFSLNGRR